MQCLYKRLYMSCWWSTVLSEDPILSCSNTGLQGHHRASLNRDVTIEIHSCTQIKKKDSQTCIENVRGHAERENNNLRMGIKPMTFWLWVTVMTRMFRFILSIPMWTWCELLRATISVFDLIFYFFSLFKTFSVFFSLGVKVTFFVALFSIWWFKAVMVWIISPSLDILRRIYILIGCVYFSLHIPWELIFLCLKLLTTRPGFIKCIKSSQSQTTLPKILCWVLGVHMFCVFWRYFLSLSLHWKAEAVALIPKVAISSLIPFSPDWCEVWPVGQLIKW